MVMLSAKSCVSEKTNNTTSMESVQITSTAILDESAPLTSTGKADLLVIPEGQGLLAFSDSNELLCGDIEFLSGGSYSGTYSYNTGLALGTGTLTDYKMQDLCYSGNLKNGEFESPVTIAYSDGSVYTGTLINWLSSSSGTGKIIYSDGDYYDGEFALGVKSGSGTYNTHDGNVIEGIWVNNVASGAATITYSNGDIFVGNLLDGEKDGNGIMTFVNGDNYNGSWARDTYNGNGKYTFSSSEYYSGTWSEGKLSGTAEYRNSSGVIYQGTWVDGTCTSIISVTE